MPSNRCASPEHTRKVSQQNRSLQGAKTHAILLSLFRSAQLQGLHPVQYVLQLLKPALAGQSTDTIAPDSEIPILSPNLRR